MLKKILRGSDAYQWLPLARQLWNKMPEGKKSYRFPNVYIDLAKGIVNYIRIRTTEVKEDAICLFATYTYDEQGHYSVSIWRVDMRGNLTILTVPGESIQKPLSGTVGDIKCGRFNHDNPSEFIFCIEDTPPQPSVIDHVEGTYRTCLLVEESKANQNYYKITADFKNMTISCNLLSSEQYYHYYYFKDYYDSCNSYFLPGSWELRWQFEYGQGEESYNKSNILDMFVSNGGLTKLLKTTDYQYQWWPVINRDDNKRGRQIITSSITYEGGGSFLLEQTDRYKYFYRKWTGTQYVYGEEFTESRNYILNVEGTKVISPSAFIYAKNNAGDAPHVQIGSTAHGVFTNLVIPYRQSLGSRSGNHPIYPSVTLLRDSGIAATINARFIETFSWGYNDFSSYTLWIGSFADPLQGNTDLFKSTNTFLAGFPNPFKPSQYFGVWISDAPDFGYGGLGWSQPPIWDGFYVIPFSKWNADLDDWSDVIPVRHENYAPFLLNHYFRDIIILPTLPFEGFYTYGASVFADYGADILWDIALIQTKGSDIYVNGDFKSSVDKTRLKLK